MINQEEKEIIEKLKAQKANVRPSRALLTSILAQLPAGRPTFAKTSARQGQYFWWLRIAIPAGVALLIGIVFLNMPGGEPTPQPEGVLSFASLGAEEEEIEQVFAQQERILADTIPTVLEQVEMSEQNVVKVASQRAAVIEEKLKELAREGKNVEELEILLADAQSKIEEATTLLHTIREDVRAKDANKATIHATRDTFRAARKNTRDAYETFRSIARETKNL